ncbi:TFIID-18kDa-domain-containing protein [Hypoxylon sp. NC1633]|nr:TFIID-18kDa-domain-containing protein [Hypoxylon sp. NC1633]
MEPRARAGKHVGKETFNRKEVATLLFAYGDVEDPLPETVRLMDAITTEFLEGICFEASRAAQLAGRQKLKFDDFEFALHRNPRYLGRVRVMMEKRKRINLLRKTFTQEDDTVIKDLSTAKATGSNDDDIMLGLDDNDEDLIVNNTATSSKGTGTKKRKRTQK